MARWEKRTVKKCYQMSELGFRPCGLEFMRQAATFLEAVSRKLDAGNAVASEGGLL